MRLATRRRGERGQALVEAALVAPLFFVMLFGVIDLMRVIWANDVVANAARDGARFASVHAGTPGLTVEASKDEIRAHAEDFIVAGGSGTVVTVCFSAVHVATTQATCSGDTDESGAVYERGNLVAVRVQTSVPVIAGAILGFGDFTVTGESIVLINN